MESIDTKLTPQYGFDIKKNSQMEDERKIQGTGGAHSLEPQKAHPTSEFILVS